jgi:hypothetical protein
MAMRKAGTELAESCNGRRKAVLVCKVMTRTQSSAELLILEGGLASLLLSHNRDGDCDAAGSKQTNASGFSHSCRCD